MRKNARRRNNENKSIIDKILIYSSIAVAIMSLILIGLFLYSKSLNESTKNSTMTIEQMANIANNTINDTSKEKTESEIGRASCRERV